MDFFFSWSMSWTFEAARPLLKESLPSRYISRIRYAVQRKGRKQVSTRLILFVFRIADAARFDLQVESAPVFYGRETVNHVSPQLCWFKTEFHAC